MRMKSVLLALGICLVHSVPFDLAANERLDFFDGEYVEITLLEDGAKGGDMQEVTEDLKRALYTTYE